MPDTPFILCGLKSDLRDGDNHGKPMVNASDAEKMARDIGAVAYCECSALSRKGLANVFDTAIRACVSRQGTASAKKKAAGGFFSSWKGGNNNNATKTDFEPTAPPMPKGIPAPWIYPSDSTLASDFGRLLDNPDRADVQINGVNCHTPILVTASTIFSRLLHVGCDTENDWIDWDAVNAGAVMPFASIRKSDNGAMTIITCCDNMSRTCLMRVLTFIYSGTAKIDEKSDEVAETMEFAEHLGLDYLKSYCSNVLEGMAELNPSIETFVVDSTARRLGALERQL